VAGKNKSDYYKRRGDFEFSNRNNPNVMNRVRNGRLYGKLSVNAAIKGAARGGLTGCAVSVIQSVLF
jgi:hypothetical protein